MLGRRGLMRLIRAHDPDQIVSTYPGVTAVLGELRRKGKLDVPCYSSITDLAGLQFWAHPGIDLHFVTHPESIEEVEQIAGPGSARWAKPPTSPAFLAARSMADARKALGLPPEGKVIAVSGGGWGVGDLLGATRAALAVPDATVLCLCGRNDDLRARVATKFGSEPRLRVMGFTDRMGDVLAASDALVHSSAGLTVLEAIIRGCPVISYGFGYGHVRASNAALVRFGLAQVARTEGDIGPALERALERRPEPDASFARRPSTASLILKRRASGASAAGLAGADRPRRDWPCRHRRGDGVDAHRRGVLPARLGLRPHATDHHRRHRPTRGRRPRRRAGQRSAGPGHGTRLGRDAGLVHARTGAVQRRHEHVHLRRPGRPAAAQGRSRALVAHARRAPSDDRHDRLSGTTSSTPPTAHPSASGGWLTAPAATSSPVRSDSTTATTASPICTPAR